MISIDFFYSICDKKKRLIAFKIRGHGPEYICSAISVLAINTINCIERFTADKFICDYKKSGGLIDFRLTNKNISREARILIKALDFGLRDVYEKHRKFVSLKIKNLCESSSEVIV